VTPKKVRKGLEKTHEASAQSRNFDFEFCRIEERRGAGMVGLARNGQGEQTELLAARATTATSRQSYDNGQGLQDARLARKQRVRDGCDGSGGSMVAWAA